MLSRKNVCGKLISKLNIDTICSGRYLSDTIPLGNLNSPVIFAGVPTNKNFLIYIQKHNLSSDTSVNTDYILNKQNNSQITV